MAYSSIILFLTFLFVFIYQVVPQKYSKIAAIVSIVLTTIIYALPAFYIIYALNFDTKITKDIVYAMSQTNQGESLEFLESYISYYWSIFIILSTIVMGTFLLKQERKEKTKIEKSLLMFLLIYILSNILVARHDIRLLSFLTTAAQEYKKELKLFKEEQEKMKTGDIRFKAEKVNKGETYIVVIGESLNKNHMGIYGYKRDTTPLLSKELNTYVKFENAYSNHTHTMPVQSMALTEANQLNKKSYYNSLSILDILNKANFETYWISNQNMYGAWDNLVSIIAHKAKHLISINHASGTTTNTQKLDGEVLKYIGDILSKPNKKNRVIFVHLMGSHADYCSRYPLDQFTKFSSLNIGNKNIDCYDNSVLYNDYIINNIYRLIKHSNGVRGLIYMSDHADDVDRGLGHNSSKFTYDMTQIPLIMWFSDEYKNKYKNKYKNIVMHKNKLFSNDFFYDTLLGIMNIQTEHYNSRHDLSSKNYELLDKNAFTLHGKIPYVDKKNIFYIP